MTNQPKTISISYSLDDLPQPITNQDVFMQAILVELRAIRKSLVNLGSALEKLSKTK